MTIPALNQQQQKKPDANKKNVNSVTPVPVCHPKKHAIFPPNWIEAVNVSPISNMIPVFAIAHAAQLSGINALDRGNITIHIERIIVFDFFAK